MLTTILRLWFLIVGLALLLPAPVLSVQAARGNQAAQPSKDTQVLNLNTASTEQLEELPGVGVRTATRILEYRKRHGPFKEVEELMNIPGIGEKSFLRLKPLVTVTPAPARPAKGGRP